MAAREAYRSIERDAHGRVAKFGKIDTCIRGGEHRPPIPEPCLAEAAIVLLSAVST